MEFFFGTGVIFVQFGMKRLFCVLAVFLLLWLTLRFALPLFSPFVLGACLALAAEPAVSFLSKRVRLPRGLASGIGVAAAFSLLSILLLLLCAFAVRQLRLLAGVLPDLAATAENGAGLLRSWLLELSDHTPAGIRPLLRGQISGLFSGGAALLEQSLRYCLSFAGSLLSHLPDSALTLGTAVLSGFMISAKLPKIRRYFLRRFPGERLQAILAALRRFRRVIAGWLLAQLKLMGVTFFLLLAGFMLLRIRNPLPWAAAVSLVDAFPVLGVGTVLLPWALISLLSTQKARAVGLLGLYLAVSLIRSALEPRLVGRQLGLDPLVTLMALYAGYQLWGIGGMIFAPLLTVTALQLLPEGKRGG